MPTYEYKCLECNYTFEEFQKMTDDPLKICPSCNGELKRIIGAGAGPIFKGSGFYQTDYKKNNNTKEKSITSSKNNKESSDTPKKEESKKNNDSNN